MAALRFSTSEAEAGRLGRKLVGQWPGVKVHDFAEYARGITDVLQQYPLGVVEECCDVRTGLAREREYPPTPKSVIDWCERRVKQHQGFIVWARDDAANRAEQDQFRGRDEHRLTMLQRLKAVMLGLLKSEKDERLDQIFYKQPPAEAAE